MNGATHRLVAGSAVCALLVAQERAATSNQPAPIHPLLGGAAAVVFTNLPDFIEPATSPNHRAFFHSITFAAHLCAGLHRVHQWDPSSNRDAVLKRLLQVAG